MRNVTIKVRSEGRAFACVAVIRDTQGHVVLHTTRPRPHGMRNAAYQDAIAYCELQKWTVVDDKRAR